MNAPTLLIGLGGVGSKIVERVSGLITPEQRESIAVVVLDTDINDLRAIRERNPFIRTIGLKKDAQKVSDIANALI